MFELVVFRDLKKAFDTVVSRIKHMLVAEILSHKCNRPFLIGR